MDLGRVRRVFHAQHRAGRFPGGQLVVRRDGRRVLREAIGTARGFRAAEGEAPVPATDATRFLVLSACKPIAALAIAILEDRGALDVDAPIAEVFPEFGRHGKHALTTRDVLTHRGGVLMPDLVAAPEVWPDWDRVRDRVADARPVYARGTLAYHPFEYGWILGEIVHRASGAPLDDFVAREIAGPADLPGLRYRVPADEVDGVARAYWLGGKNVLGGVDVSTRFEEVTNAPATLGALVPAAGVVTDADTLARFYDLVLNDGVAANGARIVSAATLRRYTTTTVVGWDRCNKVVLSVGLGFMTGTRLPSLYGWTDNASCFGHSGAFCTLGFADRRTGTSVAVVTNGNRGVLDLFLRSAALAQAARDA